MIVSCPSCEKRYLIDETVLSEHGCEVRCGVCGMSWLESSKPPAVSISSIEIDTVFGHSIVARKRSKIVPLLFLMLTIITLFSTAFYVARIPLLQLVPSLKPVYAAFGISSVNPREGLEFSVLTPFQTSVEGKPAIVIRGTLSNSALESRETGKITVTLYGSCDDVVWYKRLYHGMLNFSEHYKKCPVDSWEQVLSQSRLMPGENLLFETEPRTINVVPYSVNVDFN
jgi:predicted Zn finger-like uncharacterized protein